MTTAMRRAMQRAGALAGIALVAAVLVGSLSGGAAVAAARLDDGAAQVVAQADPYGRAAVVSATLPSSAEQDAGVARDQDVRTRAAIAATFSPMRVAVQRQVVGSGELQDGRGVQLLALERPDEAVDLDEGTWARGAGETVLQHSAAAELGVTVGGTVTLASGAALRITGLWHPKDPDDTAWALLPAASSGHEGGAAGPLLVDPQVVVEADRATVVRWLVTLPQLTEARVAGYRIGVDALSGIGDVLDPEHQTSVRVSGALGATLERLERSTAAARSALAAPAVVLGLLGAIVLAVMASGLWSSRRAEAVLLRSRGQSLPDAAIAAGVETALAAAVGAAAAVACVLATGQSALAGASALLGLSVTAGAAVVAALCAVREATGVRLRDDSRARRLAWLAPTVIAVGVSAFAVVQLLVRGSVLAADGSLDPLATVAPALALVATALLVPLAAGPAAGIAAAVARRSRGILPVLPLRQLARRASALTSAVLCVALAAGAAAFGTVVVAGLEAARARAVETAVGADIRIEGFGEAAVSREDAGLDVEAFAVGGVRSADPALRQRLAVGDATPTLVAGPAARILPSDAASLRAGAGTPLGAGTTSVQLRATPPDDADEWALDVFGQPTEVRPLTAAAWIQDARGAARVVDLGTLPPDGAQHDVPIDAAAGDTLLAVDLERTGRRGPQAVDVVVGGERATASFAPDGTRLRVGAMQGVPEAVPVVVTVAQARRVAASIGTVLSTQFERTGTDLSVRVVGIVDAIPGSAGGAVPTFAADFGTLVRAAVASNAAAPTAGSAWLTLARPGDAAAVVQAVRAATDRPVRVLTAASVTDGGTTDAVRWILVGALGVAAALAATGFVVVWRTAMRARAEEQTPLRALGMTPAAQRRSRGVEAVAVVGFAVVLGALFGLAAAWLLAPTILGVFG